MECDLDVEADEVYGAEVEAVVKLAALPGLVQQWHEEAIPVLQIIADEK